MRAPVIRQRPQRNGRDAAGIKLADGALRVLSTACQTVSGQQANLAEERQLICRLGLSCCEEAAEKWAGLLRALRGKRIAVACALCRL